MSHNKQNFKKSLKFKREPKWKASSSKSERQLWSDLIQETKSFITSQKASFWSASISLFTVQ